MRNSKVIKNIVVGFGGQFLIMVLGFVIPRVMITSYGSDTNGLVSTISQIFTYAALLEAGIGQAAKNALFKPIAEKDRDGVSYIASIAKNYYRRITLYYGIVVLFLCVVSPLIIKTSLGYWTVFWMVFFEGMSGVVSFYFISTTTTILSADGRGYITNGVNVVNKIVSYCVKICMAVMGANIVILQLAYFLITVCKTFFYQVYFRRNYKWVSFYVAPKTAKLRDRNAYIVSELAWTIFSSTDMIVLSIFLSTQASSVYGVYNMIFTSISMLLNAVYTSINYLLGQTYHRSVKEYTRLHDVFNSVFFGTMTSLMCVAYILCLPFIRLYTNGVTDVDYINGALPLMFCLVQIISWSRYVSGNLTAVAGYAKYTGIVSAIEAGLNIILSVILVNKLGIVGVLLATVLALPLKVVVCTYLSETKILRRSPWKSIRIMAVNFVLFFATVVISNRLNLAITNYVDFLLHGVLITGIVGIVGTVANYFANPDMLNIVKMVMKRRKA